MMAENCEKKKHARNRHVIKLETKLKIIRKHEGGQGITSIARELMYAPSTINTIVKDATRIREQAIRNGALKANATTKVQEGAIGDMEKMLAVWIKDQIEKDLPLSRTSILIKARSLFEEIKTKYPNGIHTFSASSVWFHRFKYRLGFEIPEKTTCKVDNNCESPYDDDVMDTSCNIEDAKQYSELLKKIIEGSYLKEQIFSVSGTGLFYHKMPSRTYIAKEEKDKPGPKASRKKVTLLLGGNASGTYKLKPLLVHTSVNPQAFKGIIKATLPVHFRSNKRGCITIPLFEDWFVNSFSPEMEKYCHENNVPFKILLILDDGPGHPANLDDISPNIKVEYLPHSINSLLLPMDQGVISNFRVHYTRRMFAQAIRVLDSNSETKLRDFWREYNIYEAVKHIAGAWADVTENYMRVAWRKLIPHICDFRGIVIKTFEQEAAAIVKLAEKLQLDVSENDVEELMNAHDEELTNEELSELQAAKTADNEQNDVEETETQSRRFTALDMTAATQSLHTLYEVLEKQDPNVSRFLQFKRTVDDAFSYYREVYEEKKRTTVATTISFDKFFINRSQHVEPSTSTDSAFGGEASSSSRIILTNAPDSASSECDSFEDVSSDHSPLYIIKIEENDLI